MVLQYLASPRGVVGQWGGAGGAICEDHLAFCGELLGCGGLTLVAGKTPLSAPKTRRHWCVRRGGAPRRRRSDVPTELHPVQPRDVREQRRQNERQEQQERDPRPQVQAEAQFRHLHRRGALFDALELDVKQQVRAFPESPRSRPRPPARTLDGKGSRACACRPPSSYSHLRHAGMTLPSPTTNLKDPLPFVESKTRPDSTSLPFVLDYCYLTTRRRGARALYQILVLGPGERHGPAVVVRRLQRRCSAEGLGYVGRGCDKRRRRREQGEAAHRVREAALRVCF